MKSGIEIIVEANEAESVEALFEEAVCDLLASIDEAPVDWECGYRSEWLESHPESEWDDVIKSDLHAALADVKAGATMDEVFDGRPSLLENLDSSAFEWSFRPGQEVLIEIKAALRDPWPEPTEATQKLKVATGSGVPTEPRHGRPVNAWLTGDYLPREFADPLPGDL